MFETFHLNAPFWTKPFPWTCSVVKSQFSINIIGDTKLSPSLTHHRRPRKCTHDMHAPLVHGKVAHSPGMRVRTAALQTSPRRVLRGRPPVKVDLEELQSKFDRPQPEAAQALGISLTCLKLVCRRLGLKRWPYRRVHTGRPSGDEQEDSVQAARDALARRLGNLGTSHFPPEPSWEPAPLQKPVVLRPVNPFAGMLHGSPALFQPGAEGSAPVFALPGVNRHFPPAAVQAQPPQVNEALLALIAACAAPAPRPGTSVMAPLGALQDLAPPLPVSLYPAGATQLAGPGGGCAGIGGVGNGARLLHLHLALANHALAGQAQVLSRLQSQTQAR
jgi:hypothetical protein